MNRAEKEISEALFGKTDYPPLVHFYDHAVPDEEKTALSGRPRFKSVPYLTIKPTHPDLAVRDFRSRAMIEIDQRQYAQEWQKYLDTKARIKARLPSIEVMPGMTVEAYAELKALGIHTCQALAEYKGDLSPYNNLKQLASRIMELADEIGNLPEERDAVPVGADRRQQHRIETDWTGSRGGYSTQETPQKAGYQEGNFSYSFTV
jgi:hypothetical protein